MSKTRPLAAELGVGELPALNALSDEDLAVVTTMLREARRRQQRQLASAFEAALAHIPMLLRTPVRKILFP